MDLEVIYGGSLVVRALATGITQPLLFSFNCTVHHNGTEHAGAHVVSVDFVGKDGQRAPAPIRKGFTVKDGPSGREAIEINGFVQLRVGPHQVDVRLDGETRTTLALRVLPFA